MCGVYTRAKYRRELQSPLSKCCRETIVAILWQNDVEMDKDDAAIAYSTGYVCRLCFETLKKCQQLKKEIADLENVLHTLAWVLDVLKNVS